MRREAWGVDDHLCRGDESEAVSVPNPGADASLVRHILYLDGRGRLTPYLSSSEDFESARNFAGASGRVWFTKVIRIEGEGLRYISNQELLGLLRGKGKGDASWTKASEVQQARAFAEFWGEHLADFRALAQHTPESVKAVVHRVFTKERA
jgi:hypothetical protein